MTIPKRLQLKLFVLLCSSCSFAPRPPLTAMSQADAMRVSEPRKQYELVQPCVLTCAPCGLEAPRFAAVSGKDTGIVQAYPLRSETA
ncbi:hypothetical protein EBZ39_18215, partial [bacterium]|nr:hypothetical protein [bacterium]